MEQKYVKNEHSLYVCESRGGILFFWTKHRGTVECARSGVQVRNTCYDRLGRGSLIECKSNEDDNDLFS